jgi:hypothetical protein
MGGGVPQYMHAQPVRQGGGLACVKHVWLLHAVLGLWPGASG